MDGHLLDDVLNLVLFLNLEFFKNVDFLHDVHDDFAFFEIFLSDNRVEWLPVKFKACSFCFDSYICSPFGIVQHRNFPKHLPLTNGLNVDILPFRPSIAMEFSLIHDIDFVSFISLSDDDLVFLVSLYCHRGN